LEREEKEERNRRSSRLILTAETESTDGEKKMRGGTGEETP